MANPEKHKKKPALEWLEAEESTIPTKSRSSHLLGAYIKIPKPVSKKFRPNLSNKNQTPVKPDVSLAREPGPPPKRSSRPSQAASREHQRKLERLPKLRAPYQYKNR